MEYIDAGAVMHCLRNVTANDGEKLVSEKLTWQFVFKTIGQQVDGEGLCTWITVQGWLEPLLSLVAGTHREGITID